MGYKQLPGGHDTQTSAVGGGSPKRHLPQCPAYIPLSHSSICQDLQQQSLSQKSTISNTKVDSQLVRVWVKVRVCVRVMIRARVGVKIR